MGRHQGERFTTNSIFPHELDFNHIGLSEVTQIYLQVDQYVKPKEIFVHP